MASFGKIVFDKGEARKISFKFVWDDDGSPRDVSAGVSSFTVFQGDGVTPLFPSRAGSQGSDNATHQFPIGSSDTAAPGGYYARLELAIAGDTLRWHGTFVIEG